MQELRGDQRGVSCTRRLSGGLWLGVPPYQPRAAEASGAVQAFRLLPAPRPPGHIAEELCGITGMQGKASGLSCFGRS